MNSDSVKRMFESGPMYVYTRGGHSIANVGSGSVPDADATGIFAFMRTLQYNFFDGKKVATCLDHLIRQDFVYDFKFGREYSPVLYVYVNPLDSDGRVQTNKVLLARTKHVIETLRERGQPDELWGVPPHSGIHPKKYLDKDCKWVMSGANKAKIKAKELVLLDKGEIRAWWD